MVKYICERIGTSGLGRFWDSQNAGKFACFLGDVLIGVGDVDRIPYIAWRVVLSAGAGPEQLPRWFQDLLTGVGPFRVLTPTGIRMIDPPPRAEETLAAPAEMEEEE